MLVSYSPGEISELQLLPNNPESSLFSNVESCCARGLPEVESKEATEIPAVLVGGGPSLASTLETIWKMKSRGAKVFALNNSAKFLVENGIFPDYQVIIDSRPGNVSFLENKWAGEVLLSSQCHPDLFDRCVEIEYPIRVWHPVIEGIEKYINKQNPLLVGGGLTVGLSGMCLAFTMGHREMHLFGYDSCHSEDKSHAYEQQMNKTDEMTSVAVDGRVFKCSVTMAAQAESFQRVSEMLADYGCVISVHGDGLIPHIARRMTQEVKVLNAVYDLGVSPPTYDFLAFLLEAEKARIEGKYDHLDIVFQPGPIGGFRNDNLPPSVEEREGMLHRICVSACRLLPSVRHIHILKRRENLKGEIFPKGWAPDSPMAHYGTRHFKNALRPLRSTKSAVNYVNKIYQKPYATITLREAEYWPERNSNIDEWMKVSEFLSSRGIHTVWVHDTHSKNANCFSWDIDLRLALYEGAVVNLGVSNGPMALCYTAEVSYLIFKPIANAHSASAEFLKAHGMEFGDQYGDNGKLVWESDNSDIIINELTQLLEDQPCRISA